MANYDFIDTSWTWDGDYYTEDYINNHTNGDVIHTEQDALDSLKEQIHNVVGSEFGDWENHINLGANLSFFRGEPNTRETARLLREHLISAITNSGAVNDGDVDVKVVPVHNNQLLIVILVNAEATAQNGLNAGDRLAVGFLYDSLEGNIFFLPPNNAEWQTI
jgi:hypothetical protein